MKFVIDALGRAKDWYFATVEKSGEIERIEDLIVSISDNNESQDAI